MTKHILPDGWYTMDSFKEEEYDGKMINYLWDDGSMGCFIEPAFAKGAVAWQPARPLPVKSRVYLDLSPGRSDIYVDGVLVHIINREMKPYKDLSENQAMFIAARFAEILEDYFDKPEAKQ